ncbi:hypothetical protein H7H37_14000, partial [Mycolicibacterium insubricum]|nr:hypothetical protein [Mycolicibacterium insubricum]
MPAQFIVNGAGKRFINEAAPYMDFAHAMIEGQRGGIEHIPCWPTPSSSPPCTPRVIG